MKTGIPAVLKPFSFHGVNFDYSEGDTQIVTNCPFCSAPNKFTIEIDTTKWRCFSCKIRPKSSKGVTNTGGNLYTFLQVLWENSPEKDYGKLLTMRGIQNLDTLSAWGVRKSVTTNEYIIPGFNIHGQVRQIYKYVKTDSRWVTIATPNPKGSLPINHRLLGYNLFDKDKPEIHLCEGFWDAVIYWESLGYVKEHANSLVPTNSPLRSLRTNINVLAVPGTETFYPAWNSIFRGKAVTLLFDNDHPNRTKMGKKTVTTAPAGNEGMKRTAGILWSDKESQRAESIRYIRWGEKGYDKSLPDGYDLSDMLRIPPKEGGSNGRAKSIISVLTKLYSKVQEIPESWKVVDYKIRSSGPSGEDTMLPCESWETLVAAWEKAMKWTDGLDVSLSVMLASAASTMAAGDQLWMKIIGPPSCGKSTLCEALSLNKEYVIAKSTIRGFHSGYQSDREGSEDSSLVSKINGKTLITKDGDTLLRSPNLGQILAEARDIYDRTSRTHYRNKMSKDYDNINMTWLLCGTSSLRALDNSELGERFLDCVVVEEIDEDEEDEIALEVAIRASREMTLSVNGKAESRDSPEMGEAKKLTAGYLQHLRTRFNSANEIKGLVNSVETPRNSLAQCAYLGKFIAYIRARPSKNQDEVAEREMSFRLVSQLVRLAQSLAVVLNRDSVDSEVMRRVRKVALDTARGRTLKIVNALYGCGKMGSESRGLAILTGWTIQKQHPLLEFLRQIKVVQYFTSEDVRGVKTKPRWRLTERFRKLYERVMKGRHESTARER